MCLPDLKTVWTVEATNLLGFQKQFNIPFIWESCFVLNFRAWASFFFKFMVYNNNVFMKAVYMTNILLMYQSFYIEV